MSGSKPDMIAYAVRETPDGNSFWNRIGVGWKNRDGKGYSLILDALPVNGKLTIRQFEERDDRRDRNDDWQP